MRKTQLLLAGLIGTIPLIANAAGPYIGAASGANFSRDRALTDNNGNTVGTLNYDSGIPGALSAGYALDNGWRGDLEFGYRTNDAESSNAGFAQSSVDVGTMMGMLWFDWPVTWLFRPYAGAGAGNADVDLSAQGGSSQSDSVFAYQLAMGLSSQLTRHLALGLDYRLLKADEAQFNQSGYRTEYESDSVMLGLRYSFAPVAGGRFAKADATTQTASAAPGPSTGAAQSEIAAFEVVLRPVNFKFDRDELTEPAKQSLDELSERLAKAPDMKVTIDGHTDFIGSSEYNVALGERRANAVKDYLAGKGVAANVLDIRSFGETQPAATNQTAEGRAENRRAEITTASAPPQNVRVVVQPATAASKEAAQGPEDPLANKSLKSEPVVEKNGESGAAPQDETTPKQ